MTLGEMRALLAAENLRLTRSLGQNFLHDGNQLRRIVALAGLAPGDQVLEIGPGLGPLTEHLLAAGARVLAIEKDGRLVDLLRRRLGGREHLEIVHRDALDWLASSPRDWSAWRLVANLPYSVGSAILVELARHPHPPASLTVTLQAEVVDRIRAVPATPEYGLLTLLVARAYRPGPGFRIPATCFFPPPGVTSACVRLDRRAEPLVSAAGEAAFANLLKRAFSQRRKQLRKLLRAAWPEETLAEVWPRLGLRDDLRAEALSPEQFAALLRALPPAA
jgi:16S rRNA (adenine1518-N6/adenine1519-N6)-dimethyltransferase